MNPFGCYHHRQTEPEIDAEYAELARIEGIRLEAARAEAKAKTCSDGREDRLVLGTRKLSSGCIVWTKSRSPAGYGKMNVNGLHLRTHRLAYECFVGSIPTGLCVLHTCDNPPCVNPLHLWLGTNQDNMDDKVKKGRQGIGERNGNAKLTAIKVGEIRKLLDSGMTQTQIDADYGVSQTTVRYILKGKTWN